MDYQAGTHHKFCRGFSLHVCTLFSAVRTLRKSVLAPVECLLDCHGNSCDLCPNPTWPGEQNYGAPDGSEFAVGFPVNCIAVHSLCYKSWRWMGFVQRH